MGSFRGKVSSVKVILYLILLMLLLAIHCGCLPAPTKPYLVEYPIHDQFLPLLGDGPPDSEVLVVVNPEAVDRYVLVSCGLLFPVRWLPLVPAGGEIRGIVQLYARDVGASTCRVVEAW